MIDTPILRHGRAELRRCYACADGCLLIEARAEAEKATMEQPLLLVAESGW